MSDRGKDAARIAFIALLVLNVLVFTWSILSSDGRAAASSRIEELQINPGRIKLVNAATRGAGGASSSACLEWGPFAAPDSGKAQAALARLGLVRPPVQRTLASSDGARRVAYYVREPDAATVARIAELQRSFPGTKLRAAPCPA